MDVMTAVLTRRSEQTLNGPAPGDAEFTYLLQGASTAPDHGRLRPWRWILLRGDERDALGLAVAEEAGDDVGLADRMRAKLRRAPLVAALVFSPREGRIPEWEQLAAATCMSNSLQLLLHARGYGSIWRTGALTRSPAACDLLGLGPGERLLGSLDIGTPDRSAARGRRPLADMSAHVTPFGDLARPGAVRPSVGSAGQDEPPVR
ncbi:nitroreductase family protein [Kitasatospora brasiliensis]|uniref:nitroreductase family protein n=1 Tax=Kitasatospora brasiliensis TaxID=3058040 RepID=UPI00292F1125|nr:nitroreductase [Kitasatospora sp. K002]